MEIKNLCNLTLPKKYFASPLTLVNSGYLDVVTNEWYLPWEESNKHLQKQTVSTLQCQIFQFNQQHFFSHHLECLYFKKYYLRVI